MTPAGRTRAQSLLKVFFFLVWRGHLTMTDVSCAVLYGSVIWLAGGGRKDEHPAPVWHASVRVRSAMCQAALYRLTNK